MAHSQFKVGSRVRFESHRTRGQGVVAAIHHTVRGDFYEVKLTGADKTVKVRAAHLSRH